MAHIAQIAEWDCTYISDKTICVWTDEHLHYRMIIMPGWIDPYMAERQFIRPVNRNLYQGFNLASSTKCIRPHAFRRKRICAVIEIGVILM